MQFHKKINWNIKKKKTIDAGKNISRAIHNLEDALQEKTKNEHFRKKKKIVPKNSRRKN